MSLQVQDLLLTHLPLLLHLLRFKFLSEGSSYTLVEKLLINLSGVRGITQPLLVTWTAGVSRHENDSQYVSRKLEAASNACLNVSIVVQQFTHLRGLPIVASQILIELRAPLKWIGCPEEPIAIKS